MLNVFFWTVTILTLVGLCADLGTWIVLLVICKEDTKEGCKIRFAISSANCVLSLLVAITSRAVFTPLIPTLGIVIVSAFYFISARSTYMQLKKMKQK